MDLGIAGRTAAIAGASSGLGFAAASALAAEGVRVAVCGRDRGRIDAAAERLEGAVPLVADVSTVEGATAFVDDATDALGHLDILVANAGGPPPGTFASTPLDAYLPALELNLLSTVAMCKAAVPAGELGDPADFGATVAFLCSAHARFVVGAALPVDGGTHQGLQ
jgi:3-oxoacyl-[acyl-carrier protein] reductase